MTIEVQQPELEALIREWMKSGAFSTVEEALIEALKSSPAPAGHSPRAPQHIATGADLVAAMQASPYKEIELEPQRAPMPVRDPRV